MYNIISQLIKLVFVIVIIKGTVKILWTILGKVFPGTQGRIIPTRHCF